MADKAQRKNQNKMKSLSVKDYAAIMGVSTPAVTMACKAGKKLVGIKRYEKVSRDWVLYPEQASEPPKVYPQGKIIEEISK